MPARGCRTKLRPDCSPASRFERRGFEHSQILFGQFTLGDKLEFEEIHSVSVVQVSETARGLLKQRENPAQTGAAVDDSGENLARVAQYRTDPRLSGGRVNQTDNFIVIGKFPRRKC